MNYAELYANKICLEDLQLYKDFLLCTDCGFFASCNEIPDDNTDKQTVEMMAHLDEMNKRKFQIRYGTAKISEWTRHINFFGKVQMECQCCGKTTEGPRYNVRARIMPYHI